MSNSSEAVMQELITGQQQRLLRLARQIVPHLTADDILQPNDFPELELDPTFRYEEGILAGMLALQMAIRASLNSNPQ